MGKRKKVNIDANPLQSVTIGNVNEKKHGWLFAIFLFGIFLAVVYFLPDIQKLVESFLGSSSAPTNLTNNVTNNTIVNNIVQNTTNNNTEVDEKYTFADNNTVNLGSVNFIGITQNENNISFSVENTLENSLNVKDLKYFFEVYSEDSTLLATVLIDGTLNPKSTKNYSFSVNGSPYYYSIPVIEEEDYTYLTLDMDAEKKSSLICTNDNDSIIYSFTDDKLTFIENTITYQNTDTEYNDKYTEFSNLVKQYSSINGINATLSTTSSGLVYKVRIDYLIYKESLDNRYYYSRNTTPRKVNFEMEASFFDCK